MGLEKSEVEEQEILHLTDENKLSPSHVLPRKTKKTTKPPANPLQRGMTEYLTKHLPEQLHSGHRFDVGELISSLPKRFTIYPPLLLLPANAFSASSQWHDLISPLDDGQLQLLYECISASFSGHGVTHIAINAPIVRETATGQENKMRSPTGLIPLYGNFGPLPVTPDGKPDERLLNNPTEADFKAALWASAVQNSGITQVWAPVYSMFSRGNISEKARILGLGKGPFEGLEGYELGQSLDDVAVVDMYAGIGYFVFSYLRRGVGRVWAWEINAWSVEGLRKGCEKNGWEIMVVNIDSEGWIEGGVGGLVDGLSDRHRVVAFLGDNSFAADVLRQLREELERRGKWKPIRHVNLGLLPSSKPSWQGAVEVLDANAGGWIHVHENVDVESIGVMQTSIERELRSIFLEHMDKSQGLIAGKVACRHVEKVKTYAPGVMHCVFDMYVTPTPSTNKSS